MRRLTTRFLLLALILLAFARLTWRLDAKDLWLDETFSLQRAEAAWPELLAGCLPLTDGVIWVKTTDQHPFAYFVLLGLAVRTLGRSEFALRFPSVIAATLVVPAIWAFGRRLARGKNVPPTAPLWAALLAAINPFYLWFGQEVRMYAQVALLALLSTYLLLRWADATVAATRRRWLAGYVLSLLWLLASHYFTPLILPVHALIFLQEFGRGRRGRMLIALIGLAALMFVPATLALWLVARDGSAGTNWSHISLRILVPDLVNAFTLGLSVDLAQVWPLDALSAALALIGVGYGLMQWRRTTVPRGWLLPALLSVPPALLLLINMIRPAYMTARHMSLISAFFILLVAAGAAALWQLRRWAGVLAVVPLAAGVAFSTINYFTLPAYDKGEQAVMGRYLAERVQPGDLVLFRPIPWGRLYRYYFPVDAIEQGELDGLGTSWRILPTDFPAEAPARPAPPTAARTALDQFVLRLYGSRTWYECPMPPPIPHRPAETAWPLFTATRNDLLRELDALIPRFRRVWLVRSDGDDPVSEWLRTRGFHADSRQFASPAAMLRIDLILVESPVREQPPSDITHATDVRFGDQVRLIGYDVGRPLMAGGSLPVTLYWQPLRPLTRRYKYILAVETLHATSLQPTETEPYSGFLSTPTWPPNATIVEYTGVQLPADVGPGAVRLKLQVYDAETLEKLPVARADGVQAGADPFTIVLSTTR
ncbi:MAG: glycosyltransferase family 39 protein [Anaerolineae bacterium]